MKWLPVRVRGAKRLLLALSFLAVGGAGWLGAACSSDTSGFTETPEAGKDGTTPDDSSTTDSGNPRDAGRDVLPIAPDAEVCTQACGCQVTGDCDLLAQNCPNGQECNVVQGSDGGLATGCVPTRASQRLPKGHTCCPNAAGGDPCLPGLICLGNDCTDGGAPTARCTPHCCQDSNGACGQSDPEGFAGQCDYNVSYGNQPAFFACSYTGQCKFFGQQPCPNGFTCIPQDKFGTAKCYDVFNPDGGAGGAGEMQPCTSANSCADGLLCVGPPDGGSYCRMLCLVPLSNPPFDAGALEGGAFHGGCSAGRSCNITFNANQLPAWLGACAAPDGG